MKRKLPFLLLPAAITLALAATSQAQGPGDQGGPGGERRPPPPVIAALDTDRDGELSADEIAKAADSLKQLDKNGDGKLSREELRPARSEGGPGGEGRRGGQGGAGGPGGGGRGPQGGPPPGGPRR